MKLSIAILALICIETLHQDSHVVVSGFQVLPTNRKQVEHGFTKSIVPTTSTTLTRTTTPLTTNSQSHSPTALHVFGGLFGGGSKLSLSEEPMTIYSRTTTNVDDEEKQYEALGEYLEKWSKLFTNGNIKLTTPVTVELVVPHQEEGTDGRRRRGIRLLFKDTKTGYKSKTEEKESNQKTTNSSQDTNNTNDKKKQAANPVKQGGVEILVEKKDTGLEVTAKRCDIEEDTIIKEMSEETILNELKQAIEVWKRETKQ